MSLTKTGYCQSCGAPLFYENVEYGTNKDGSKNNNYCCDCFKEGKFTKELTIDQMVLTSAPKMANLINISVQDAIIALKELLPQLNRWI